MLISRTLPYFAVLAAFMIAVPQMSSAETMDTSVAMSAPYPGLPTGVQFELKTDENGRAILATILCENSTASDIQISVIGGVVYAENSHVYPGTQYVIAESELLEGKYRVPAHSKVVISHVSLHVRPVVSSSDAAALAEDAASTLAILPFTDWLVRAKLDVFPLIAELIPNDEHIIQLTFQPVTVIVEDTIQMDYRWGRLDVIMNAIKRVNSSVVSTQSAVYDAGPQLKAPVQATAVSTTHATKTEALARSSR
ncbi:MAG: hypothetical protein HY587_05135 [Candidatus Omnitrophica bacterium]|nr:hypothetical protein [Candidatus Omnitrophota bacterium]